MASGTPWWRRWWALLVCGVLLLALVATLSGGPNPANDPSADAVAAATPAPPEPAKNDAAALARRGRWAAAVAAYERAGRTGDAERVRRRGARALYRSARLALRRHHFASARRLALQSRRLRSTRATRAVIGSADAGLAKAKAAAAERRRLARIARDARTCTSAERATVREGAGTPAGCAAYAAERAVKPAPSKPDCDPNYTGACLKPDSPDYDCAGGSGDGPDYTGPVESVGSDPYDLDRDGDGAACEG